MHNGCRVEETENEARSGQQRLNHQLIGAIQREESPAALRALANGADANCRDDPRVPQSWKTLWDLLCGHKPRSSNAATSLLLLLEGEYPRADNPQLVEALLAHGARVNDVDAEEYTPLVYALYLKRSVTARLLIERCTTSTDRQAISIGGDSAGGNLAAAVSLWFRDHDDLP